MARSLPARPSLSSLHKQAKQLLKRFRAHDPDAQRKVRDLHPRAETFSSLRDAQLVVAREYGSPSWRVLTQRVELALFVNLPLAQQTDRFLDLACVQYNGVDRVERYRRGQQLLEQTPGIADVNLFTAVVAGKLTLASDLLRAKPALAQQPGGPRDWPPILYLTYSRISIDDAQVPVSMLRLLLEYGADPNSHTILWENRFTALTGAMGEGEAGVQHQPAHQCAEALVRVLLEAGARPDEVQGLYNTHFTDDDRWLSLLIEHGLNAGHRLNGETGAGGQTIFDYQLCAAVGRGYGQRVELLLAHGADANAIDGYNGRSAHTNARLYGHEEIAARLLAAGAVPEDLAIPDRVRLAVAADDRAAIDELVAQHPDLKTDASLFQDAAAAGPPELLERLIDLGFDIDGRTGDGRTALHRLASSGELRKVRLLVERGARLDLRDAFHRGTPIGFAHHCDRFEVRDYLMARCSDVFELACAAMAPRLAAVLSDHPTLARARVQETGNTPLHVLGAWSASPVEGADAGRVLNLLLQRGADINAANDNGETPLDTCLKRDDDELAALLLARGARRGDTAGSSG